MIITFSHQALCEMKADVVEGVIQRAILALADNRASGFQQANIDIGLLETETETESETETTATTEQETTPTAEKFRVQIRIERVQDDADIDFSVKGYKPELEEKLEFCEYEVGGMHESCFSGCGVRVKKSDKLEKHVTFENGIAKCAHCGKPLGVS